MQNRKIGVMVAIPDGDSWKVGISVCRNPYNQNLRGDEFNPALGEKIALGRIQAGKPLDLSTYPEKNRVRKQIEMFLARCHVYFGKNKSQNPEIFCGSDSQVDWNHLISQYRAKFVPIPSEPQERPTNLLSNRHD